MGFVYRSVFCNQQEEVTFERTIYLVTIPRMWSKDEAT